MKGRTAAGAEHATFTEEGGLDSVRDRPLPVLRSILAGLLMGLANLVPGVSGGTMVLVCGLYDEFITAIADVTRLRFTRRNVLFLSVMVITAGSAIVGFAGILARMVHLHHSAMYALFIGLTLGGAPMLFKLLKGLSGAPLIGLLIGLGLMVPVVLTGEGPSARSAVASGTTETDFHLTPNYPRDAAAGVLGMSAMVLPGVSGAYMLLLLDRYEMILASIAAAKAYVLSSGKRGDPGDFLPILIPTALGAIVSLIVFSNLLKWMLRRHQRFTFGILTGIVLGSVIGIWPFDETSRAADYAIGMALASGGFLFTARLATLGHRS